MSQANSLNTTILSRRAAMASSIAAFSLLPGAAKATEAQDRPATAEEWAAMEFGPADWIQEPPTNEQWVNAINPHLVMARFAWHTCQKTKTELLDIIGDDAHADVIQEAMKGMEQAKAFFQYFVDTIDKAQCRIVCAGTTLEVRDDYASA
jgi:hypothetical protein